MRNFLRTLIIICSLMILMQPLTFAKKIPRTYTWTVKNSHPSTTKNKMSLNDTINITLNPDTLSDANKAAFFSETEVTVGNSAPKKLSKLIPEKDQKGKIVNLNLTPNLALKPGDIVLIRPYLGFRAEDSQVDTIVVNNEQNVSQENERQNLAVGDCIACNVDSVIAEMYQQIKDISYLKGEIKEVGCDTCFSDSTGVIYYDFKCKKFYKLNDENKKIQYFDFKKQKFKKGDQFQLVVKNVNRYRYQVTIKADNVFYTSKIPPLLNELFLGGDTSKTVGSLISVFQKSLSLSGGTIGEKAIACVPKLDCQYRIFMKSWQLFDSLYNILLAQKISAYTICAKFPCCDSPSLIISSNAKMLNALSIVRMRQADLLSVLPEDYPEEVKVFLANSLPSKQELMKLQLFVDNMVNPQMTYITPPSQIKGNTFDFNIQIKPWDSVAAHIPEPFDYDSTHYSFLVAPQWFSSFSTGSFVTFNKFMQNKVYDWQPVLNSDGTVSAERYRLTPSGYSVLPTGLAAFANFENKITENFGWGASAGVGITLQSSPSLAYLVGGSAFIGNLHQFAVTFGCEGMHVNRLNENLEPFVGSQSIFTAANRPALNYYKQFRLGLFVSVSFTPFKTAGTKDKKDKIGDKEE